MPHILRAFAPTEDMHPDGYGIDATETAHESDRKLGAENACNLNHASEQACYVREMDRSVQQSVLQLP